ncbi:MAG: alanine racemase, partial [Ruminococcus sp.]|nr:alanine racemase [Ruminococcus sp.]
MKPYLKRAWAEISLPALRKNIETIRRMNSAETEIMAVVKADAYGHGDERICRCL